MGNMCCGEDPAEKARKNMLIIKAQSLIRMFIARRRMQKRKHAQMVMMFSADKKNHKDPNTLMLT